MKRTTSSWKGTERVAGVRWIIGKLSQIPGVWIRSKSKKCDKYKYNAFAAKPEPTAEPTFYASRVDETTA